jgi:hypothetical protein
VSYATGGNEPIKSDVADFNGDVNG